jgi:hypothetical protein
MVDVSDIVVALWDGEPARGRGGTADIVAYARAMAKPLLVVNPATGMVSEERIETVAEQLQNAPEPGSTRALVERLYLELDSFATTRRPTLLPIILLHLFAEIVAAAALAGEFEGSIKSIATAVELGCLISALALTVSVKQVHATWLHSRSSAELCRSFLAAWGLRRRSDSLPHVPSRIFSRLYHNLHIAWLLDGKAQRDFSHVRDEYLQNRVEEQIQYFAKQHARVAPLFNFWRWVAATCTILAIVYGCMAFVQGLFVPVERPPHLLAFLTLLLPVASAAILSVILAMDWLRRAYRYREMLAILNTAAERLRMTRTWDGLTRIAVETEEALLQEVVEWHSLSEFGRAH